jgi:hypothetical protein
MNRLLCLLLGVGAVTSHEFAAQPASESLQGVWQVVEVRVTGPTPQTITIPEPRPNLTILTARHYSRVEIHAGGPRPMLVDVTKASADELRAAWGPFAGEAGTYEVSGNLITMRPIVAKNPAAMAPGAFTTWTYELTGETLRVTAKGNQNGPVSNPVTVKALRVE